MATADTLLAEARRALAENQLDVARQSIKRALGRAPTRIDLLAARACIELASGEASQAANTCRQILARQPHHVPSLNMLGEALRGVDDTGAEAAWRSALRADPRNAETLFHLGNLHAERNEPAAAISAYEKALETAPHAPSILVNLGLQLDLSGRREDAERCYRNVLADRPGQIEALANLGALLFRQRRFAEALPLYDRIVALEPAAPAEIWNNRGVCQKYTWNNAGALQSFRRAFELAPSSPEVLANLGFAECERGRYEQARSYLQQAQALVPQRLQIRAHLLDIDLQFADWTDFERKRSELVGEIEATASGERQTVAPFAFMSVCDDPRLQFLAARNFAWPEEPIGNAEPEMQRAAPEVDSRLRLGFVSTVFHEHPVPRLIVDLLERLDRGKFEIYAYLVGTGAEDAMRSRITTAVTAFRDMAGRSAGDIVGQIRADKIAILFDIAGHTEYARPDVFAARAAPVQVNYLGQAGTLGARYYDYIGTDPYTTPPEEQSNFAERFWYLGDCYFPCDPSRPLADPLPTRAAYGLAEDAFVFTCQAAAFKVVPSVFVAWMRLLQQVEHGLLWLRPMLPLAQANLHAEAASRGVDPRRIVFAPKEALPRYLARYRLADLYLDTHPFGSHTTVNDALYAGLAVVTLAGRSVAGRASAAQVRAVGLPELVVTSFGEYEALALSLARDRERLATFTARLRNEGRASALFDMESYARRFQVGLGNIWDTHLRAATQSPSHG